MPVGLLCGEYCTCPDKHERIVGIARWQRTDYSEKLNCHLTTTEVKLEKHNFEQVGCNKANENKNGSEVG